MLARWPWTACRPARRSEWAERATAGESGFLRAQASVRRYLEAARGHTLRWQTVRDAAALDLRKPVVVHAMAGQDDRVGRVPMREK